MSIHVNNWAFVINIRVEKVDFIRRSFLEIFSFLIDWLRFTCERWRELLYLNCSDCSRDYVRYFSSLSSWKCWFERDVEEWSDIWTTLIARFRFEVRHIAKFDRSDWIWIFDENIARLRRRRDWCQSWRNRNEKIFSELRLLTNESYLID